MLAFNKLINKDIVKLVAKKNYFNRKKKRSNEKEIENENA